MAGNKRDLFPILQACLDDILGGCETLDSVSRWFPGARELLCPGLETARWLKNQGNYYDPLPEFVSTSRKRLVDQLKQENAWKTIQVFFLIQSCWLTGYN